MVRSTVCPYSVSQNHSLAYVISSLQPTNAPGSHCTSALSFIVWKPFPISPYVHSSFWKPVPTSNCNCNIVSHSCNMSQTATLYLSFFFFLLYFLFIYYSFKCICHNYSLYHIIKQWHLIMVTISQNSNFISCNSKSLSVTFS